MQTKLSSDKPCLCHCLLMTKFDQSSFVTGFGRWGYLRPGPPFTRAGWRKWGASLTLPSTALDPTCALGANFSLPLDTVGKSRYTGRRPATGENGYTGRQSCEARSGHGVCEAERRPAVQTPVGPPNCVQGAPVKQGRVAKADRLARKDELREVWFGG